MTYINTTQPKSPEKVTLPVEGRVFFQEYYYIIHCTKPCLVIFCTHKRVIIITDSCFKSQEIDLEHKVADSKYTNRLLGYVFKKANKGCLEVIYISEFKQ